MISSFKKRRFILRLFLPFFTLWLVVFPARDTHAILPLVAWGLSAVTTTGITITATDLAGLAIAVAGMGVLTYLKITDDSGNDAIAIPLGTAVPPPVGPDPISAEPGYYRFSDVNLNGGSWYIGYCGYQSEKVPSTNNQYYTMVMDSCTDGGNTGSYHYTLTPTAYGLTYHVSPQSGTYTGFPNGTPTMQFVSAECPTGSVLNGSGTCDVTIPQAVYDDNRQDFLRVGDTFAPIEFDKIGSITAISGTTNSANDSLTFTGANSLGAIDSITAVALPGGGVALIERQNLVDNAGTSYVATTSLAVDADGNITDVSSLVYNGVLISTPAVTGNDVAVGGSVATGAPTYSANPSTAIPANPAASPAATTPIVFPNDYARSGEAAAVVVPIVDALAPLSAVSVVDDPVLPVEADMPGWGDTFTGLLGWSLPAHSSACPQPSVDLSNVGLGVHVLNSHCGLMNTYGGVLQGAMQVVFVVLAMFLVLGA